VSLVLALLSCYQSVMCATCDSSGQSGNGSSAISSVTESVSAAGGSVDISASSHQDSMAEVARQVFIHLSSSLTLRVWSIAQCFSKKTAFFVLS